MAKHENENHDDFISRVIENKIVCKVKLADLSDNMDLSRIPNPTQENCFSRIKYGYK
ncbi:MAG: hypothetical protein KGZ33_05500 [Alkaliphilus sp.]|nr:hypothetical protein [Alkaliphilus sp.]